MSESSDGAVLQNRLTGKEQLEVRLVFDSKEYTLRQLTTRFQDIEALFTLLLRPAHTLRTEPTRAEEGKDFGVLRMRHALDPVRWIQVETVSLNSPLEILVILSGGYAVLKAVVKLAPQLICIKNEWNESRVKRASTSLHRDQVNLERQVVRLVAEELQDIDLEAFLALPASHPSKQILKRCVRALSDMDKIETKGKSRR